MTTASFVKAPAAQKQISGSLVVQLWGAHPITYFSDAVFHSGLSNP